jgi:hypothetical protein
VHLGSELYGSVQLLVLMTGCRGDCVWCEASASYSVKWRKEHFSITGSLYVQVLLIWKFTVGKENFGQNLPTLMFPRQFNQYGELRNNWALILGMCLGIHFVHDFHCYTFQLHFLICPFRAFLRSVYSVYCTNQTYSVNYILTYLLHGAESFMRS